jgi:hypothetical protein
MTTANLLDHVVAQIEHVRAQRPELRLGQLMAIVGSLAEDETGHSLWDVEDADFIAALHRFASDATSGDASNSEQGAARDRGGVSPAPESNSSEPPRQVS